MDDSTRERAPAWAATATEREALLRGLLVGPTTPGLILFSTSIGFGALARDAGFSLADAAFIAATVYALPGQVVLVDQFARGATLVAVALAVSLTAVRLLPMTVTLMPLLREPRRRLWPMLMAVHTIGITGWLEGLRRLPALPAALRLPHFLGIGLAFMAMTIAGTLAGHLAAGLVPRAIAAVLLFATPIYFILSLVGNARSRSDRLAVGVGLIGGPLVFMAAPGFELVIAGVGGGTLAWLAGRRR
jgi:predicted branched-subunit amino acid permease